jgi:hypothetical protein
MHKTPSFAFTRAPLLLSFLAALSCGEPPVGDDLPERPGVGGMSGGEGDDLPMPGENRDGCPKGEPKIGESCPASFGDGSRCSYLLGSCLTGGTEHDVTQDYCCFAGLWNQCAAEEPPPPCDQLDAAAPDAAEPGDAGAPDDAGDAADDAGDGGAPEAGEADAGAGEDAIVEADASDDLASD